MQSSELKSLADPGIRNGCLDVVRMAGVGWDTCMLDRAFVYALVRQAVRVFQICFDLIDKEMRVAMTLTGAKTIADITSDCLVKLERVGLAVNR